MCYFAVVGAETQPHLLREAFADASGGFDTELSPRPAFRELFNESDAVVCVTLSGCSCLLLPRLAAVPSQRHAATFRAALANVARRFGGARLLVTGRELGPWDRRPRPLSLSALLSSAEPSTTGLFQIRA